MKRRTFFAAAGAPLAAATRDPAIAPLTRSTEPPGRRLLFLDSSSIAEQSGVRLVPPTLKKLGMLITNDSPGDSVHVQTAMGCGLFSDGKSGYRLIYSGRSKLGRTFGMCVADSPDGIHWTKPKLGQVFIAGEDTNQLQVEGVAEDDGAHQPSFVRLRDGRWRMYFWLHAFKPKRSIRYVAAESADGLRWKVVNLDAPCLRHPAELGKWAWKDGPESLRTWPESGAPDEATAWQWRRMRSNDAVHTYEAEGGGFEMYSVFPLQNSPATGRYVAHDNAPFMLRCISRRTSEDGLRWSDPEFLVVPDKDDPWDQQFYYLTRHRVLGDLRVGFLGHYRLQERTMDIELAWSRDGRVWNRPMRGAWLPRGKPDAGDSKGVYMPHHLIDHGDRWLALYTGTDARHHEREERKHGIFGLEIPRYRFAGLAPAAALTARIRTAPFFLSEPHLYVDADLRGSLQAELCDPLGNPLPGHRFADSVDVSGDKTRHELRWGRATGGDYRYDAVSVRLEWTGGTCYGVFNG